MSELTAFQQELSAKAAWLKQLRPNHAHYASMEEFVLREGRVMKLTPQKPKGVRRMTAKECFSNATRYVEKHPDCLYAEGFVWTPTVPMALHHAWVVNPYGYVIDPTLGWERQGEYMGVSFPLDEVYRRILKSGYYGLFTDGFRIHDLVLGLDPYFKYTGL